MPVGSITLPVSHLPSACSFYLEVLQSLNYKFVEEKDGRIGFGPDGRADLFLCQQHDGQEGSTAVANISFTAPSGAAIDTFAAAAPRAGGSILAKPTLKDCEFGRYSATVLDLDGNKISATCEDPTMSTASYPMSVASSKRSDEGGASDQAGSDGAWRITVRSQTSGPSETPTSDGSSTNALVGTLLGVAAGAALTYLVGKERQSNSSGSATPDNPPAQARRIPTLPYIPPREIEYPMTPRSYSSVPVHETTDYFTPKPKLLRSVTYHYDYPASTASSTENYRYFSRSQGPPSVSETSVSSSSRGRDRMPLMIETGPSRASDRSNSYQQILPPSPPSSVSSRSQRSSRRAASPSPVRSTRSKASSRRSHSVASSQRTIRAEQIALPASVAASRVSASRSHTSSHRSKHAIQQTEASSEASWHSAEQNPQSRKTSVVSRNPASIVLPESRKTSVVSRNPASIVLPESRKSSVVSRHTVDIPLPESRKTSVISRDSYRTSSSRTPHDYPLPESRKTSVVSRKSASSARPYEVELPPSEAGSRSSASTLKSKTPSATSRRPHDYALPESRRTSVASRIPEDVPLPSSRKTSVASRIPEEMPLPGSRKTSVASRIPEDVPLPRSDVGSRVSTSSTLRPPKPTASALALQEDDTESLAPSDSISQISVNKHRKKHRHHESKHGSSSGSHREHKKRSVVSMPEREVKKEKEKRGVATMLGL